MMTTPVGGKCIEQLLARYGVQSELVVETTSDGYFELLEKRFPLCGSKIDWDRVEGAIQKESDVQKTRAFMKDACDLLKEIVAKEGWSGEERVVVIGDSAIEQAIKMPLRILQRTLTELLELPQHLYILHEHGDWCLSFTMEGDLCFGYATIK